MIDNRIWYFGTALVAVAVLALGWLLGVSPKLDEAAAAESDLSTVESQNHAIQAELRRLSVQFDDLSDMREDLADLRKALPEEASLPSFLAELERLRAAAPVTLAGVSVSDALPYAPSALADAAATDGTEDAAATGETTADAPGDAAAPGVEPTTADGAESPEGAAAPLTSDPRVTAENLVLIPVEIEATGSRAELTAFLGSLQAGERLYLVTDVSTEVNTQPTDPGDYRSTITGYLYVLLEGAGNQGTTAPDAVSEPALPAPPVAVDGSTEVTDQ